MKIRIAIRGMLRMCPAAWECFLRLLQTGCVFLFGSLLLLLAYDAPGGGYEHYIQARAFQEYSQVALLLAAVIPVCLEELAGPSQRTPPGSSGR